jgi:hypothetical protein
MRKNLLIKLESSAIRSTPIEGRILADGKYHYVRFTTVHS